MEEFILFDGLFVPVLELEKRLLFRFLLKNDFEDEEEQKSVWQKGIDQFEEGLIKQEALDLGERFHLEIASSYIAPVFIRTINPVIGCGLYADRKIAKGSYVGEYTGVVRKNNRRYTEPLNGYCYEYPVPDEIGRNYVIDATSGNLTRFINHSGRQPNLQPIHVFYEGYYHLIFIALKEILPGDQLSYDYGQNYWMVRPLPQSL
ncbi:MAG: SET domain-containing protein-lysine N-methyltransferase [Chlamydiales bacterium]|nr:SET domain-containing protein-lysine N-methyltransferase [Chlamydiales bacterium]